MENKQPTYKGKMKRAKTGNMTKKAAGRRRNISLKDRKGPVLKEEDDEPVLREEDEEEGSIQDVESYEKEDFEEWPMEQAVAVPGSQDVYLFQTRSLNPLMLDRARSELNQKDTGSYIPYRSFSNSMAVNSFYDRKGLKNKNSCDQVRMLPTKATTNQNNHTYASKHLPEVPNSLLNDIEEKKMDDELSLQPEESQENVQDDGDVSVGLVHRDSSVQQESLSYYKTSKFGETASIVAKKAGLGIGVKRKPQTEQRFKRIADSSEEESGSDVDASSLDGNNACGDSQCSGCAECQGSESEDSGED